MSGRRRWAKDQTPAHEKILTFLQDNGATGATAATVAVLVGESASQARHRLDALVRRGRAVRTSINGTVAYRAKHPSTSPETKGVEHVR